VQQTGDCSILKTELQPPKHAETRLPSEVKFWTKLRRSARWAGRSVVEKALCLYYAASAPTTPAWAKSAMAGGLAYFILPLDAMPDVLVGLGYTDDLVVLAAALATVAAHVLPEHIERAQKTLGTLFTSTKSVVE